jgi:hypothetical protein
MPWSAEAPRTTVVPRLLREFNRNVYQLLAASETGNFVYSPYSLHMALSLLCLGAPEESNTRKQLVTEIKDTRIDSECS